MQAPLSNTADRMSQIKCPFGCIVRLVEPDVWPVELPRNIIGKVGETHPDAITACGRNQIPLKIIVGHGGVAVAQFIFRGVRTCHCLDQSKGCASKSAFRLPFSEGPSRDESATETTHPGKMFDMGKLTVRIAAIVAVVLVLPVLYVLSTGPVVYLCDQGILSPAVFHAWCGPLARAVNPTALDWLVTYWSWWGNV